MLHFSYSIFFYHFFMSETPQAYDLSKIEDTQKLFNGLTLAEKNALREKFSQEKQDIIYLTKSEVQELKDTIKAGNNQHSDSAERAGDFLEQQKSEGLSLSDLTEWNPDIHPELQKQTAEIEQQAQEFLFGNTGYMNHLNLSESSQDSLSLWLSLFILETLARTPLDATSLGDLDNSSLFLSIEEKFTPLKELKDMRISGNGDKNMVLQDPLQAKEIFTMLAVEEADAEQVKEYIEGANFSSRKGETLPAVDLAALQNFSQEQLLKLQNSLLWTSPSESENPENKTWSWEVVPNDAASIADMSPEEKQGLIARLKAGNFLERIFAWVLEALEGMWIYKEKEDTSSQDESSDTPETKDWEIQDETVSEDLKISLWDIPASDLGEINKKRLLQDLENPEYLTKITALFESIDTSKSAADTLKDIFSDTHKFQKFSWELKGAGYPRLTDIASYSSGTIFEGILEEYARYRNDSAVQGKEKGQMKWSEYAQSRKTQNWSTGGK